jgi:hypothetical protein
MARSREPRFETRGAVAVDACPRLGAVQIAAAAARVRILHFLEGKIFLPVLALFSEWCRTKANLDPFDSAIVHQPRSCHIAEVLVTCNGSAPQCSSVDSPSKSSRSAGLQLGCDQIAHVFIVRYWPC